MNEHMKPFIIPEISVTGKAIFPMQIEGISAENFAECVKNRAIVAYAMPLTHTFKAAWIFRIILDNGASLDFSSACTMVDGWQEVGSLNVQYINHNPQAGRDATALLMQVELPQFRACSVEKLIYETEAFRSECGMEIKCDHKTTIVVMTGNPPGSVSVEAPFSTDKFEPEFYFEECSREAF